ncbi:hypothetical protein P43SY_008743 [Pythium insidiosum]|uniref:Uncharacterized protein n=1 Tax=Pythium insidiosum TaxID=114742 RepID=A0AAD5M275_PYTIN|nr:hypothetical protein P43SY_008743 [Pythium insidiosum]
MATSVVLARATLSKRRQFHDVTVNGYLAEDPSKVVGEIARAHWIMTHPGDGTLRPPNATLLRLSLMDAEYGRRRSESVLHNLEDSVVLPSTSSSIVEQSESYDEPPRSMRTESNSSSTSSGSASWIDRKNWWQAFRRGGGGKGNAPSAASVAERSASGGVSFAAFSPAPQALASRVRASSATLSQHDADTSSRIINWSESPTGSRPASPSLSSLSRSSSMETPICVLTVVTRLRELHLEFSDADVRDLAAPPARLDALEDRCGDLAREPEEKRKEHAKRLHDYKRLLEVLEKAGIPEVGRKRRADDTDEAGPRKG